MAPEIQSSPLSDEQRTRISQLLSELDSNQLHWLSGYLAGYLVSGPAATGTSPAITTDTAVAYQLTILVGTQTGNAEGVAEQMAARAAEKGIPAKVIDLADYKPKQLKQEQYLAVVTSTHGEGEPPDNAIDFREFLLGRKAPKVPDLRYSVLSLGDSSYEFFCQTGKEFDERLAELRGEVQQLAQQAEQSAVQTQGGAGQLREIQRELARLRERPAYVRNVVEAPPVI